MQHKKRNSVDVFKYMEMSGMRMYMYIPNLFSMMRKRVYNNCVVLRQVMISDHIINEVCISAEQWLRYESQISPFDARTIPLSFKGIVQCFFISC